MTRKLIVACCITLGLIVCTIASATDTEPRAVLEMTLWKPVVSSADPSRSFPSQGLDIGGGWGAEDDSLAIGALQLGLPVGKLILVAGMERMTDLEGRHLFTTFDSSGGGIVPITRIASRATTMRAFDLGIARRFETHTRGTLVPWVGLTHLHSSYSSGFQCGNRTCSIKTEQRLIGLAAGFEATWQLTPRLRGTGRLLGRWAGGHSEARHTVLESGFGSIIPVTTSTTEQSWRLMLGGEAGLRWLAASFLNFEAGWRVRDWRYDGGPAREDGPFARLVIIL
jgi:hypothetical protein